MSQIEKLKKASLVKGEQYHPEVEFELQAFSFFQTTQAKCLRMCEKQTRRSWREMRLRWSDWLKLCKL